MLVSSSQVFLSEIFTTDLLASYKARNLSIPANVLILGIIIITYGSLFMGTVQSLYVPVAGS
jgi:hypothetical protein